MAQFLEGNDAKIDINGTPYNGKFFRIRSRKPRQDWSNFEGAAGNPAIASFAPGYSSFGGGNRVAEVEIREATFDGETNLFEGPTAVAKQSYCTVKIYPNGRDNDYHEFNSLYVEDISHEAEAGLSQPMSFMGVADGLFLLYGEDK